MATSGSRNFIHTRDTIINAALRKLKVVQQGESATSVQLSEAAEALNSMVLSWQAEGINLWNASTATQALTSGTVSYTVNSDATLLAVEGAWLRIDNYDFPITLLTRDEYYNIPDKALASGQPSKVYVEFSLSNVTFYVYPIPDGSYTLHYSKITRLQDFDSGTNNPDFPVSWSDALIYGLAYKLAPEYGVSLQERVALKAEADEFKRVAKLGSQEPGSLRFAVYAGRI